MNEGDGGTIVVDIGKTNAKASLWSRRGEPLARRSRTNASRSAGPYRALDLEGIEHWLLGVLA